MKALWLYIIDDTFLIGRFIKDAFQVKIKMEYR